MSKQFYALKVNSIREETPTTKTVFFKIPENLQSTFQYTHGQYLTLRAEIKGEEVRRAYSMCSSPLENDIAVTVKRVDGGRMSNHIHDQVSAGDTVEVMPPEGRFFTPLGAEQRKDYYLFGAGSGITPLMSMLKTILEVEPMSTVYLLYGSRNEEEIIFRSTLEQMQQQYADQLIVTHILSQPKREKGGGVFGFMKKSTSNWTGKIGRITAKEVAQFLEEHPSRSPQAEYFICGPGTMIDTVEDFLVQQGIDQQHLHTERFVTVAPEAVASSAAAAPAPSQAGAAMVKVELDGSEFEITVPEGKTILDVLIEQKYDAPYSCTSGACSTCMAKVTKGTTKMDVCYALDDDEVEEGYILTCQAKPTSPEVEVTFEV